MDEQELWQATLADLEIHYGKVVFQSFLSRLTLLSLEHEVATIGCAQPMLITLIENRYADHIRTILSRHTKKALSVRFTIKTPQEKKVAAGPLFSHIPEHSLHSYEQHVRLNPDYTFDTFAVSSTNQMAYAAATAVAHTPGTSYNPLFLYGGVGVGKTHLMQAIGHRVLQKNPRAKFIYCTGEEFTNEIIEAIGAKTTRGFKRKYRQSHMLLIDDIQFIAGKNAVQEEFFHTFNAIQQVKGQVILTSDRPPDEISKLEDRLRSRFEGGLTIDIGQPDFELRTAILLIKAKQRGITFSIDLAKRIASVIENPRKLEGVLIRVLTEAQMKGMSPDETLLTSVLGKYNENNQTVRYSAQDIIKATASYYQIKLSQLKGSKRDVHIAFPRQVLYYLLKVEIHLPLVEIGNLLGGRDHTTILHGVKKISGRLPSDAKLREDIVRIKNQLSE